ncbi:MAG: hypothetical protein SF069_09610 [Phycisphaerae bacterium]|nr:hypothetical protein [Phycisphaerae bacterium]
MISTIVPARRSRPVAALRIMLQWCGFSAGSIAVAAPPGADLERLLASPIGSAKFNIDYETRFYPSTDVTRGGELELFDQRMRLTIPVEQSESEELTAYGVFGALDTAGEAILSESFDPFPDHLWDIRLGFAYRKQLEQGRRIGGNLELGSASDRPFASLAELLVQGNLFYLLPTSPKAGWLFLVNYSNNRDFAQFLPLPGAAWFWRPSEEVQLLAGAPLSAIRWQFAPRWTASARYFLPRTGGAEIKFDLTDRIALFTEYVFENRRFARADREDSRDRLFLFEQRAGAGVRWTVNENAAVNLFGGYAFDRFAFEGRNFDDRDQSRIDFDDGPVFRLELGLHF